jgi:hypothetical protein
MSEHDQQVSVVKWFKLKYPKYKNCILSIPNGSIMNTGGRGIGRYKWAVAEGFNPGASDLFIAIPVGRYGGFWLEMKDVKKTKCSLSKNQKEFIQSMLDVGYHADWAAGAKEAISKIELYMRGEDLHEDNR